MNPTDSSSTISETADRGRIGSLFMPMRMLSESQSDGLLLQVASSPAPVVNV